MFDYLLAHIERVKHEPYTTLVITGGDLYERYYPSYDRPDYTRLKRYLTREEITFLESHRVSNRDK